MFKEQVIKIYRVVFKSDRTDGFRISYSKLNNPVQVATPLTYCQIITQEKLKIYNYFNSSNQNGQILGNKSMQDTKQKNLKWHKVATTAEIQTL